MTRPIEETYPDRSKDEKPVVITFRLTTEDAEYLTATGSFGRAGAVDLGEDEVGIATDPYQQPSIHQIARMAAVDRILRYKKMMAEKDQNEGQGEPE